MRSQEEKILVIGACGQIGVELTAALRRLHGSEAVIATDLREPHPLLRNAGPYYNLDVMDGEALGKMVRNNRVTQIYLLAAVLSATGEKSPLFAWALNMQGLFNVLEIAKTEKLKKVFWPSSIAVFGPDSPPEECPQQTVIEPTTVYGISKYAGELWCRYYFEKYGVDVRSIRYPGLISYKSAPGGGTTDYAVAIFHEALAEGKYTCFLNAATTLPMMYMPDAVRATIELMEAPAEKIRLRTSYNIAAVSFSPAQLAGEIKKLLPDFKISYKPDYRQAIADSWPSSIDDSRAAEDWGWSPEFGLQEICTDMLKQLCAIQVRPVS